MHRSYVSKSWIDAFLNSQQIDLPDDVASRFIAVLRVKPDEEVAVFDGAGREIIGLVEKTPTHTARLSQARVRKQAAQRPALVVMQAALEESKLSQTIQRGTEFGVDRFIVFDALRSDRFCFAKLEKRATRLVSIAQEAARQSGRFYIPSIDLVAKLDDVLASIHSKSIGIYGDVAREQHLSTMLKQQPLSSAPCYIAIGPEGGFAPAEKGQLTSSDFHGVMWAPHVLRAELACLAAVAIINSLCGRA